MDIQSQQLLSNRSRFNPHLHGMLVWYCIPAGHQIVAATLFETEIDKCHARCHCHSPFQLCNHYRMV